MLKRTDRIILALLAFWLGTRTRTLEPEQPAAAMKPASTPVLDHLEKTLSDNYRKEIDQEENVWRTIPFFVAALAFEVNIIAQVKEELPKLEGQLFYVSIILTGIAVLAVIASLYYLLCSINFAKFKYIASEPELADFANRLEAAERAGEIREGQAIRSLKMTLVSQYAVTTANNRSINSRRVRFRTSAGFAILVSILATLLLGGEAVFPHIISGVNLNAGSNHADHNSTPPDGDASGGSQLRRSSRDDGHRAAPDPSSRQGPVHAP